MKRSDRVYQYVLEMSTQGNAGVTAAQIETDLNIQRANASRDLNQLVREGLLFKLAGRPVQYVANLTSEKMVTPLTEEKNNKQTEKNVFDLMVGSHQSLKLPVEQAKAAILYPPNGLNCLITGETGSGKTYFAKMMFEYAKQAGLIETDKKLVVFNCADYAHNTELLMSHLFGYVEGAFTGANKNKEGLIQEADNGMLLLDEVHRLPPEGQEMIFYFMDHGLYNRLGETLKNQQANVRIVCATTEDPSSSLLATFVRRIPINIQLLSYSKRTPKEKIDLATQMLAIEAERIGKDIVVPSDVLRALIGSVTFGNVGQLKSNTQLICARAFLNSNEQNDLVIEMDQLPYEIKAGLTEIANDRLLSAELSQLLAPILTISATSVDKSSYADAYELPYDLYEMIGDKMVLLKSQGVSQEEISSKVMEEINSHLRSFYYNHGLTSETGGKLIELVDEELVELTKEIHQIASHILDYPFQVNFVYAISLHISAYLRRISEPSSEQLTSNENIRQLVTDYPREYEVALIIKELIANKFQTELPPDEVDYLTLLIVSLKENYHEGKIGVIVAAHGDSTASSMVQVAKQLFGNHNIAAVDMPLDMSPKTALKKIIEVAKTIQYSSGLLLLVDMGSLVTFGDDLEEVLNVEVRILDMVTTSIVLEAARKADFMNADLISIHRALTTFNGYGQKTKIIEKRKNENQVNKKKAIVAMCASGKGAAQRMKSLILDKLSNVDVTHLEVLPISVLNMKERLKEIEADYDLLAVTGIVNPKISVPFYTMEELLTGRAIEEMRELLIGATTYMPNAETLSEEQAKQLCETYLDEYCTFINSKKVLPVLWQFTGNVFEKILHQPLTNFTVYLNVIMHLSSSLERALREDPLTVEQELLDEATQTKLYQIIAYEVKEIEEIFNINYSDTEIFYINENIKNALFAIDNK